MAIEIATAFVQVVPSMKGVGKAIESAFGSASETAGNTAGIKAGNGFAGGFGAKLGVITGIAQSVAGKAIEAFMGLSGEITSASDSAQKFASTLNFAGVSEKQIKRLTASTQDYADKTVYDLNDIRNTTAQLAANGVPNYDRLAEAAGNLNAVAGGSADTFKSVAMVLTQTAGQGKLTTENWNQLSDAIPGASGKIQQALKEAGAYTGNFRDAMADGQITAQEFNDAIMSLGFTDAAVEAATSASTIEGATGNLEAAFVKLGASVLDSVKPAITGGMSWIADGVTNAVPVVQAGIQGVIGWFQRLYSKLEENDAIVAFKSAWDTIRDAIMGVVNMVIDWAHMIPPDGLANGIKLVADTLNWFVQHGKELAPIIIGIGTAFAAVKGYQALNSGLQALTGTMTTVTTAAKGVSNGIMLMMDLGGPVAMLKQMAGGLSLVKTAQTAWSTATKMATAVQGAFNAVIAANPIGAIVVAVAAVVAALVWFFTQTEVGRKAWAAFQWVRNTISNLGSNLVGWAKDVLGIHSPSRIFRDEVGKWVPAGMAQGIDKASGLVADSIDGLTDMIPTVSLKTDTSMLETPYAYQTRVTGGRMAYTIDDSQGEYATKQDIIDAIDQALSSGITLNLSDRGGEVMAGKLAKPMSYELDNMARLGR